MITEITLWKIAVFQNKTLESCWHRSFGVRLLGSSSTSTKLNGFVCWEGLRAGGEGDNRGWDGWMASLTRWTWVWVNSGSWWWTGRPGVLWFTGPQRVGHDWATELNWTEWGKRPVPYSENFRMLIKEIEDDRNRWKDIFSYLFLDGSILLKWTYYPKESTDLI